MPLPERRSRAYLDSGAGWAMVADIITGTLLWGGVGYLVDGWLGTRPWIMALGFFVGNAIGIYAAMLHVRRMGRNGRDE